jgi:hypothetical protein
VVHRRRHRKAAANLKSSTANFLAFWPEFTGALRGSPANYVNEAFCQMWLKSDVPPLHMPTDSNNSGDISGGRLSQIAASILDEAIVLCISLLKYQSRYFPNGSSACIFCAGGAVRPFHWSLDKYQLKKVWAVRDRDTRRERLS